MLYFPDGASLSVKLDFRDPLTRPPCPPQPRSAVHWDPLGLPGMCLQCASQGEKDEDHCKTTFSGGQNAVLTRVLKRTMEMAALMGRLQFLLLELLSTNTCVNTYASARKTHGSKCTKTNLSKAFRANHGTPANTSEPSFQHALVFWIKTAILWTKKLCPFQRCL